jgi:putative ABC transport system permease protein
MLHDLRFAVRRFARQRGFFVTAVLTIALGIGLSATVFAVVDGVLFRPLPYRDPERLVAVYGAVRAEESPMMPVSYPDLVDWRAAARTVDRFEGYDLGGVQARVRGTDETLQVPSAAVTSGFFELLGARAGLGRTFLADDFTAGAQPVAVISYRIWRGAFGGDPAVLGRTLDRGDRPYTIVGVMARQFVFPIPSRRFAPEVMVPFDITAPVSAERNQRSLYLVGRLAPRASIEQAQAELDAIALRLKPLFVPRPNTFPGAFDGATVMDLRDQLTRASRSALWLVFAAAATVFLIACMNVVSLLLAQAEDRRRELAVRTAIGASRWALARQLLVEATLLATAGAAAGWLISAATFGALARQVPRWLQLLGDPGINGRTAAFALIMAALTVIVAGLVPALRASAEAPRAALADGGRQAMGVRRGRHVLLLAEVALATLLLSAGSIMLRSWLTLNAQESGMDAERVIAVRATPARATDAAARARFNALIADAVRRVPGVEAVAWVDMPLLQSAVKGSSFVPPSTVRSPAGMDTDVTVTPNYFSTMGVPIRMGRGLADADRGRRVVISEALARRYWPGRNPVGETIRYGEGTREIAGVAGDARDVSFDRPPTPTLYHPWDDSRASIATVLLRFSGPADRVMADVRRAVREAEPAAAITMLATVDTLLSVSIAPRTFNTMLFGVFGAAGVLVALIGIYALVSFLVARREREMGIRLALGATARGLKLFVVAGILRWVTGGVVVGLGAALLCAQYLKPFVYQIPADDPRTLALVSVTFVLVAAGASYLPARRAARVDPMIALRTE